MTPAVAAALALSRAETLPLRRSQTVELVARNAVVAHVFVGRVTRSGRYASTHGSMVCRANTRRPRVVQRRQGSLDLRGRRLCGRCLTSLLPGGLVGRPLPFSRAARADLVAGTAYEHLAAVEHLVSTVAESHEFSSVLMLAVPADDARRGRLDAKVNDRRARLRTAEMTDEERDAVAAKREAQLVNDARVLSARRSAAQLDKAMERSRRGRYLMPHERELLDSA